MKSNQKSTKRPDNRGSRALPTKPMPQERPYRPRIEQAVEVAQPPASLGTVCPDSAATSAAWKRR